MSQTLMDPMAHMFIAICSVKVYFETMNPNHLFLHKIVRNRGKTLTTLAENTHNFSGLFCSFSYYHHNSQYRACTISSFKMYKRINVIMSGIMS